MCFVYRLYILRLFSAHYAVRHSLFFVLVVFAMRLGWRMTIFRCAVCECISKRSRLNHPRDSTTAINYNFFSVLSFCLSVLRETAATHRTPENRAHISRIIIRISDFEWNARFFPSHFIAVHSNDINYYMNKKKRNMKRKIPKRLDLFLQNNRIC